MNPLEIIATNEDLGRPIDSECITYDVYEKDAFGELSVHRAICDTIEQAEKYIREYQMDAYVVRTSHRIVGEYEIGEKLMVEKGELK